MCSPESSLPFTSPLLSPDGFTYERSAIMQWLSTGRRSSPVTNLPFPNTLLVPNRHLKTILDRKLQDVGDQGSNEPPAVADGSK